MLSMGLNDFFAIFSPFLINAILYLRQAVSELAHLRTRRMVGSKHASVSDRLQPYNAKPISKKSQK